MAPKTPNIQLLGETLTRHYRLSCELCNTYPIGRFTHQFSQGKLEINLADIDLDHLEALCHTLHNKVTPLFILIYIPAEKEVGVKTIQRVMRGISLSLALSLTMTELSMSNVILKGNNLNILCQGLSKTRHLKILSLRGSELCSSGAELLCQSIKNVPSITHLVLTHCSISEKGAFAVANLMQHQRMNRDSAMWQDTLRLRQPHLDGMRGLRRVTLNDNPHLGDKGLAAVADVLLEDLWIKAIDLQHCGLTGESGTLMKNILKTNQVLEIVDLRRNPFIPKHLVNEVTALLSERQDDYAEQKYLWLDMMAYPPGNLQEDRSLEGKGGTYAATGRTKETRRTRENLGTVQKKPSMPRQLGIPWRVEHRLYERKEGLVPGTLVETVEEVSKNVILQENDPSHQPSERSSINLHKMKRKLERYKKQYRKERDLRKRAEKKLSRLEAKIRESHILDEGTVTHIETCFQKFQIFLSHLQKLGFHKQLVLPEFNLENDVPKKKQDMAQGKDDSEYRKLSNLVPELYEPSHIPHPIVLFNDPLNETQIVRPKSNTSISAEEEHILAEPSISPEKKTNLPESPPEKQQKPSFKELSEAIQIGSNMLSLLPRGEAFEEVSQDYESHKESEEDEDEDENSYNQDEEESSSVRRVIVHHATEATVAEKSEDITSEESVTIKDNYGSEMSHQPFDINEATSVNSSESQGFPMKIQNAADLSPIPIEILVGRKEAVSVSSAEISQMRALQEPSPEHEKSLDVPNMQGRAKDQMDKGNIVKGNSQYSYPGGSAFERQTEINEHKDRKDQISSTEFTNRNSTYKTDDQAELGPSNEVSETDDEKLRMRQTAFNWSGRSGSVSSSMSITEHLSHSHNRWSRTKDEGKQKRDSAEARSAQMQKQENEIKNLSKMDKIKLTLPVPGNLELDLGEVDYDSDFEMSDVEGVSISASSLTSTSIPDDLVTPGEEEF